MSIFRAKSADAGARFLVRALKARLRDERAELAVIRRHLRPGDIACDIGANKGSFIYWLSRWVRDGRVVAFEPQPELARNLSRLCDLFGLANVTVEAKAVYSHSGAQDLYIPEGHGPGASVCYDQGKADSFAVLSVPAIALDDYFPAKERVALLKIDVEGAELAVLRGSTRILRSDGPLLVFECENRHLLHGHVGDVFAFLESLGYEGHFVCRHRLLPISQFDAAIHQRQDGEWFWKRKDYCNNFIFRKPRAA
ncbi:FkbM family methyltransferase [Bradyrhizobium guangzhouense]|uniref:FkbM family methyltransferase n=1 Tax=Bradyrhizobium guangzhouense TaxID=1325095 RepID=UPI001009AF5C|nr:FkbM family methyltransferase [Bradyrhizobium guangzhouense]RXH19174.1 FkbM family methyltransferase [Bradyrhizobium guangzhouense]